VRRAGRAASARGKAGSEKKKLTRGNRRRPLRIDILSLFPGIFDSPFAHSLLLKADERGLLDIRVHDIRDHAEGRHRPADDAPYGGGDGRVMMPGPVVRAIEQARGRRGWVVLLSPAGRLLTQAKVRELAGRSHLVLVCGRYGGIDDRVGTLAIDEEISIGDYVLGGGESAAVVLVDAVTRLVPGVVGNRDSTAEDSFADGLLEYPQFTRPPVFRGLSVPEILRSGDHARVARWRRKEALRRTLSRRPDLISGAALSTQDHLLLSEIGREARLSDRDAGGEKRTAREPKGKARRLAKPKQRGGTG
jgi:tRNA (guanine37-N1)-methyltransferase